MTTFPKNKTENRLPNVLNAQTFSFLSFYKGAHKASIRVNTAHKASIRVYTAHKASIRVNIKAA